MYRPWLNSVDLNKRILEIGPLAWPNIIKGQAKEIFYADVRSTDDIKDHYKNDKNVPQEKIVDIDYVINGGGYSKSLENVDKFDYIIATHVIEHIPQLILFFQDISNILNPQGKVCLTIPDKRYCFDHYRIPTSFAELYDIYMRRITNSPLRVLDHFATTTINDPAFWWNNTNNFDQLPKSKEKFDIAKNAYMKTLNGEYIDAHFSVFTPETFLLLVYYMICYNLFSFKCVEFQKTEVNTFEFNCVLEFEPRVLNEDSIENKKEKENIINLLIENPDSEYSMMILETVKNDLQKSNNELEITKNDLQAILSSKSWKITAPLRKIKMVYNKFVK